MTREAEFYCLAIICFCFYIRFQNCISLLESVTLILWRHACASKRAVILIYVVILHVASSSVVLVAVCVMTSQIPSMGTACVGL